MTDSLAENTHWIHEVPAARFWMKVRVAPADACWEWLAFRNSRGYGHFNFRDHMTHAHRAAYLLVHGSVPADLEIDHLCRNRGCVNPAHLEAVTHAENVSRGHNAIKTECVHGHEYDAENTIIEGARGVRRCRTCKRATAAQTRARSRARKAASA